MASWSCRSVTTPRSRSSRARMGRAPPTKDLILATLAAAPLYPPAPLGYHLRHARSPPRRRPMPEPIPAYHERLPDLEKELTERGHLGLLVLDASPLAAIEDQYGMDA